jgi:hypothetical protein
MLTRSYYILGSLLLTGYLVVAFGGWEFGNPVRGSAPGIGETLSSSGRGHAGSRGWFFWGGGGK